MKLKTYLKQGDPAREILDLAKVTDPDLFGLGTMVMQVVIGATFANIMRVKKLSLEQIKYVGRSTAARTLYLGGIAFAAIGASWDRSKTP